MFTGDDQREKMGREEKYTVSLKRTKYGFSWVRGGISTFRPTMQDWSVQIESAVEHGLAIERLLCVEGALLWFVDFWRIIRVDRTMLGSIYMLPEPVLLHVYLQHKPTPAIDIAWHQISYNDCVENLKNMFPLFRNNANSSCLNKKRKTTTTNDTYVMQ